MTISAEQSKVPGVRGPVLEAPRPSVLPAFRSNLAGRINVVDVEGAVVSKPAPHTLPAELLYQSEFAHPIARALVDAVPVLVPVVAQAGIGAKAIRAGRAAVLALAGLAPAMGEIAGLAAKLCALVGFGRFAATLASIHGSIIPKYFDIACKRIEAAYAQGRLFEEPANAPEQKDLLGAA